MERNCRRKRFWPAGPARTTAQIPHFLNAPIHRFNNALASFPNSRPLPTAVGHPLPGQTHLRLAPLRLADRFYLKAEINWTWISIGAGGYEPYTQYRLNMGWGF